MIARVTTINVISTVSIVLVSVYELAVVLERKMSISDFLWKKVRALAEEGNCNKLVL
jgi:hypothetical protein